MNAMIYRVDDAGQIKSYEESAQGYLTCYMTVSRVGDLLYRREDGRMEVEHVPAEELFDPVSLATLVHKPILKGHPSEPINSTNIRKYLRGGTSSKILVDGDFLTVVGVIHDEELVSNIKSGQLREVSAGYWTDVKKDDSGRLIQTARRYDHIALVERGRAGPEVRVHFDASESDLNVGSNDVSALHTAALSRWKRPLSLSRDREILANQESLPKHQQPLRLTKKSVGRVMDKIGGGPFDHLKRQQG